MNDPHVIFEDGEYLEHYGVGHLDGGHSGRYPWGSGLDGYQRYFDFYTRYNKYKKMGLSKPEMAEKLGCFNERTGKASTTIMAKMYEIATNEHRAEERRQVLKYVEQGLNNSEIARLMGKNESSIRSLRNEGIAQRQNLTKEVADKLKTYVDEKKYVDIGPGSEYTLGVTSARMDKAVAYLEEQGYVRQTVKIDQMGTNFKTDISVLAPPGTTYSDILDHKFDIKPLYKETRVVNENGDLTSLGMKKPEILDSKRVMIRYAEEGGKDRDGLIELRPGKDDISIGPSQYAQVRIAVDGTHYLKGMAIYNPNLPKGVDVIFNTNKHLGTPMINPDPDGKSVLKPMKTKEDGSVDWDNPFGATIDPDPIKGQYEYTAKDGTKHISTANVVNSEGTWMKWDKNLASQFLSKQSLAMADRQLKLAANGKKLEFEEIKNLTNPIIKKKLLIQFADECDSAAVELKAAPFPKQQTHVILPFPEIKENEIYAPNYKDGTRVACVRYPHAGPFEIAELTVRNKGSVAEKYIKDAPDAVGINAKTAEKLSGADFDGDTVVVIPLSEKVRVRSAKALDALKDFDPKEAYPKYEGMEVITNAGKQQEMGRVTNLITDMTLKGASIDEIARAVKHSMVVIDAEKHELDYKRSERENRIKELKDIYQEGGASSIISRAKSEEHVPQRKDWYASERSINPETGEKIYTYTNRVTTKGNLKDLIKSTGDRVVLKTDRTKTENAGKLYFTKNDPVTGKKIRTYVDEGDVERGKKDVFVNTDKEGKLYVVNKNPVTGKNERIYVTESDFSNELKTTGKTTKSTKMAERDPYDLVSKDRYPMELVYANYASQMKSLGNLARKEWLTTEKGKKDPEAAKKYKEEVESLDRKLKNALMNAPRERQAQLDANRTMALKERDNPDMTYEEKKKKRGQAITASRNKVGAKKETIKIDDKEWEAIQNYAIAPTKLEKILDNSDLDILKERATPRKSGVMSDAMISLAKSMKASGFSNTDIADRLGVSTSTIYNAVK